MSLQTVLPFVSEERIVLLFLFGRSLEGHSCRKHGVEAIEALFVLFQFDVVFIVTVPHIHLLCLCRAEKLYQL